MNKKIFFLYWISAGGRDNPLISFTIQNFVITFLFSIAKKKSRSNFFNFLCNHDVTKKSSWDFLNSKRDILWVYGDDLWKWEFFNQQKNDPLNWISERIFAKAIKQKKSSIFKLHTFRRINLNFFSLGV